MSIETTRAGIAIGLAGLLCACVLINRRPPYDTALPAASGEHAAQATARYRTDKVKKPERPATSTIGGGSSSGSAGPQ